MRSIWTLGAVVLAAAAAAAAVAQAQPPFAINGLHTELVFSEAVALAEKLGGKCHISLSRSQDGGSNAECEFTPCSAPGHAGECKQQGVEASGLTIAAQPILRISLEAPGESAPLTSIMFLFDGSHDIVATYLKQTFGAPNEGPRADEKSWSHSRRLHWTQGVYRMGLMDTPKLLILGADRTQE